MDNLGYKYEFVATKGDKVQVKQFYSILFANESACTMIAEGWTVKSIDDYDTGEIVHKFPEINRG